MPVRDYYEILAVAATASPREIRLAFRRLARQYSPDIVVGDHGAATLFVEIEEAYRVLRDPMRRTLYDQQGQRGGPSRGGWIGSRLHTPPRGSDLHRTVEVSFEEALRGSMIRVPVARKLRCDACGGVGGAGGGTRLCPDCGGQGRRGHWSGGSPGVCGRCHAAGEIAIDPCPRCFGEGLVASQEEVEILIPPSVDTGSQLRISGKGDDGPRGGPAGDLVILTRVRPHPFFVRKGDNLHCELPITLPEAILGARISVPTPDGTTVMTVPPGTQSGQLFRLRGKGCPRLAGSGRGDLYVSTRVVIPGAPDATWAEMIASLESLYPEHPRSGLEMSLLGREGRHGR